MNHLNDFVSNWSIAQTFSLLTGVVVTLFVVLCLHLLRRSTLRSKEQKSLADEVSTRQQELDEFQSSLGEIAASLSQMNRQLTAIRNERDTLAKQCEELKKQEGQWKSGYQEAARKYNDLVDRYNKLVEKAKGSQAERTCQIQTLEARNQSLQAREHELGSQLMQLQESHQQLTHQNQTLNQHLQHRTSQRDELSAQTDHLNATIQRLQEQNEHLQRDLLQVPSQKEAISRLEREKEQLQQELKAERETSQHLRELKEQQTVSAEQRAVRQRELTARNERAEREAREAEKEAQRLRQENQDLNTQIEQLKLKVEKARSASGTPVHVPSGGSSISATSVTPKQAQAYPVQIPSSVSAKRATIGLDFGTHSTKVMLQTRNEETAHVLFVDEPAPGYPDFAVPSLVRLAGDQLFFGRTALQKSDGTLFPSLKVSLLPPSEKGEWRQRDFPAGTTPDLLVAMYISWILNRLRDGLARQGNNRASLNVAAPMNHLEDAALKDRYLHVVHAAWEASFGTDPFPVHQGVGLSECRDRFEKLFDEPIPDLRKRQFEILPETLAPLVSLSQDPRAEPGFHLMADIGAGTTEISISHLNERGADQRILCYCDESILLGGNNFTAIDSDRAIDRKECQDAEKDLVTTFIKRLKRVWALGFQKDAAGNQAARNRWSKLRVILAGGGLRRASLESAVRQNCIPEIMHLDQIEYQVSRHRPRSVHTQGLTGESLSLISEDELTYLAVAHGLSLERQKWPTIYFPGDVGSVAPREKVEDPYAREYSESDVG